MKGGENKIKSEQMFVKNFLPVEGDDGDYTDDSEREDTDDDSNIIVRWPCIFLHDCNK